MGPGVTRRTFLARSGIAVAALAAAGTGLSGLVRRGSPRLTSARRRTYVALVDALGRGSRSQVDPARRVAAADWLRDVHYPAALEPTRAAIDDVLDRLAERGFARLDPVARIALLRELAASDGELAARAIGLAAAPFHPPAGDYHPTPVVL